MWSSCCRKLAPSLLAGSRQWGGWSGGYAVVFVLRRSMGIVPRKKNPQITKYPDPIIPRLAPKKPVEGWDVESEEEGDWVPTWKCQSLKKKTARWSLHMARIFATFSDINLKNAIKWAFLPDECYDCAKTLQRMEACGLNKRKKEHYLYLAELLLNAEPRLVEYILHSLQNEEPAIKRCGGIRPLEMHNATTSQAQKWFDGIMQGDKETYRSISSLPDEMFDRDTFRRLMRSLKCRKHMLDKLEEKDELWVSRMTIYRKVEGALKSFLEDLARKDYSAKAYAKAQEEEKRTGICKPFPLLWK